MLPAGAAQALAQPGRGEDPQRGAGPEGRGPPQRCPAEGDGAVLQDVWRGEGRQSSKRRSSTRKGRREDEGAAKPTEFVTDKQLGDGQTGG